MGANGRGLWPLPARLFAAWRFGASLSSTRDVQDGGPTRTPDLHRLWTRVTRTWKTGRQPEPPPGTTADTHTHHPPRATSHLLQQQITQVSHRYRVTFRAAATQLLEEHPGGVDTLIDGRCGADLQLVACWEHTRHTCVCVNTHVTPARRPLSVS